MTIMAATLTVACNFSVGTCGTEHNVTPEAEQTIREYRELLEAAGVRILEVGLVPSANYINFIIEAQGLETAKKALNEAGIPIDESAVN